jgi:NADH pyrophosphatase NudC (nudix superfamily)
VSSRKGRWTIASIKRANKHLINEQKKDKKFYRSFKTEIDPTEEQKAIIDMEQFLKQVCDRFSIELRKANRFYPSTQLCSRCGDKVKKKVSEREHRCRKCGLEMDRDLNAAINLRDCNDYRVVA